MEELILEEQEIGEPQLTYWKPSPKPAVVPPFTPGILPYSYSRPFHSPLTPSLSGYQPPPILLPAGFGYPPYVYNQQQLCLGYEGERRRMPQSSQVSPESLLNALSSSNQDDQAARDSLIHDEVTRAAKTLFSKRNRTLMHWLKPNISKSQLKLDVNATWECLPQCEKVFYISQVLGKFAPHTTSLMVNPQLEPTKKESLGCIVTGERGNLDDKLNTSSDSGCPPDLARSRRTHAKPKVQRVTARSKGEPRPPKRRADCRSEDEMSCDSGMVVDSELAEKPVEEVKIKRKYSKRKPKAKVEEKMVEECNSNYSPFPVEIRDIKKETERISDCSLPVKISDIKKETECNGDCSTLPVKISDIKKETDVEPEEQPVKREKRKYIKRKLIRKKYKKREPKNKTTNESPQEATVSSTVEPERPVEDMDIWIELSNDADLSKGIEEFGLHEDEVDHFWDNIDDPNSLFIELEIE